MRRLVILLAAAALAGCGSSSSGPTASRSYTDDQVIRALELELADGGPAYQTAAGCRVYAILTTRDEVDLYRGGGSTVATNPAGTVGVKFEPNPPLCADELEAALAKLR